jgi:hypothetical protein
MMTVIVDGASAAGRDPDRLARSLRLLASWVDEDVLAGAATPVAGRGRGAGAAQVGDGGEFLVGLKQSAAEGGGTVGWTYTLRR